MDENEKITAEWLEQQGFERHPVFGFAKKLADGPDETSLSVFIGTFPWNAPAVSIYVGGFGIVTEIAKRSDLAHLLRLLQGSQIDHPYVMGRPF